MLDVFYGEKTCMRAWRAKLLFMMIVYFAGFATAIYTLAPAQNNEQYADSESGFIEGHNPSALRAGQFAQVANAGFAKFLSFAEEKTILAGRFLKQKLSEQSQKSEK
jgi:hypothetical protein